MSVIGLSLEDVRNTALVVAGGAVVLAVVVAWVIKAVMAKLLSIVLLGLLAGGIWSQRAAVQGCADRVGISLAAGAVDATSCTFFGQDVTVTSPFG